MSVRVWSINGVTPVVDATAFVHPSAVLIGDVLVGAGCYIGPCACLRGDFGRIDVRARANLQDCCVMHGFPGTDTVVDLLLEEATRAPELWNQQSYLARQVTARPDGSVVDEGIVPLQHFVDAAGPDAVAIAVETDDTGDIHPALYVRRRGRVVEHLLAGDTLLNFRGGDQRAQVTAALKGWPT